MTLEEINEWSLGHKWNTPEQSIAHHGPSADWDARIANMKRVASEATDNLADCISMRWESEWWRWRKIISKRKERSRALKGSQ